LERRVWREKVRRTSRGVTEQQIGFVLQHNDIVETLERIIQEIACPKTIQGFFSRLHPRCGSGAEARTLARPLQRIRGSGDPKHLAALAKSRASYAHR
jgi:hypothetical protein